MSTQVQFRRGTTGETAVFTGAVGEVTVDTDKNTCVVHDGTTVGGFSQLKEDGTNSALSAGSLTSCSLKFDGDFNTGFISPGPDQLSLVTGGVSRLTMDGSGSVTIPGGLTVTGDLNVSGSFESTDQIALIVALG